MAHAITLEEVLDFAKQLSPADRSRLVQEIARLPPAQPTRSQYGALAHLGPGPSMEDFDEVRRELSADFDAGAEET